MHRQFSLIVVILLVITVNGNGECCTGYIREYDHSEACYWFENGKCCADNAVYSTKYGELIGTENARRLTEDESSFCRQCFRDIVEC
ncbi:unnamed protein product [Rotaria magnacalcarata]|uniref:Uncharacterized protein n=3 Tax=Rotaria magnacalcarata TaxID=392030 RepID=A0A819BRY8_9BILA|nr:unnamed protein product [Rotaria magnacalcarata]CAF1934078.1 unnamed protein product [Rotaria magnacalcarata]CAF2035701.1 unnamed protein product [Rotaria magnacalcarata]CAF2108737.1 unnamed protein product [Rotaria magnacalcarata]CAF3802706.1 unnamed protein product [Rotaria magnacalcarata]